MVVHGLPSFWLLLPEVFTEHALSSLFLSVIRECCSSQSTDFSGLSLLLQLFGSCCFPCGLFFYLPAGNKVPEVPKYPNCPGGI